MKHCKKVLARIKDDISKWSCAFQYSFQYPMKGLRKEEFVNGYILCGIQIKFE